MEQISFSESDINQYIEIWGIRLPLLIHPDMDGIPIKESKVNQLVTRLEGLELTDHLIEENIVWISLDTRKTLNPESTDDPKVIVSAALAFVLNYGTKLTKPSVHLRYVDPEFPHTIATYTILHEGDLFNSQDIYPEHSIIVLPERPSNIESVVESITSSLNS